jgi:FAD/FMN-containing dehydrogenase
MRDVPLDVCDDSRSAVAGLASRIRGEVLCGRHDRMLYATDASIYQVEPLAVVVPRDADDVQVTVAFCAEHGLPLLSRGGGTSLAGQAVNAAVVLDFSRGCTRILEVDPAARLARVEPGVVLDQLNRRLAVDGLMFGPDVATATHATIGGMIGNNSAGALSILYGRTVEHVVSMDALLADGAPVRFDLGVGAGGRGGREGDLARRAVEIVRSVAGEIRARFPRTRRRVNGYNLDVLLEQAEASPLGTLDRVNLASLLCGSEGTLAVMTEATVRLVEAPRARGLSIAGFADVDAALRSLAAILETKPAAVELIDDVVIDLARGNTQCARYVELLPRLGGRSPGAVLYVEYFGEDPGEIAALQAGLGETLRPAPAAHYRGADEMERAWTLRRSGEPLLHALPGARKPITFVEDLAVAAERLPDFVPELRDLLARHGTRAAFYAHASVGCLHVRPLIDQRDPADRAAMEAILVEATDLVRRYDRSLLRAAARRGVRLGQGPLRPRAPSEPGQHRRPTAALGAPAPAAGQAESRTAPGDDVLSLRPGARLRRGGRALQRSGRLPQNDRRRDVPVVPRDAGGAAFDARARQRPAPRHLRSASGERWRRSVARRRDARDARSLPLVQGVQERVPEQRGPREAQGGVPGPGLPEWAPRPLRAPPLRADSDPERRRVACARSCEPPRTLGAGTGDCEPRTRPRRAPFTAALRAVGEATPWRGPASR